MIAQLFRCLGILTEWFLDDDTIPSPGKPKSNIHLFHAHAQLPILSDRKIVDNTYFWPIHVSLIKRVTDSNTDGGNAK